MIGCASSLVAIDELSDIGKAMGSFVYRILSAVGLGRALTPSNDDGPDLANEIRMYVERDLRSGFYDAEEIVQSATDALEDEADPATLKRMIREALEQATKAHAAEKLDWPTVTDCDRLDKAFAELEEAGVISRQNFSCCGTCGSTEIWDEVSTSIDSGKPAIGYTFYHMQDTESAVEGYGLYLNYGACAEGETAALDIGHRIVRQLEDNGLKTDWDGSWAKRIAVSLDWKRR